MPTTRDPHPLDHHESFRAILAAAAPVADLAARLEDDELVGVLALACGDLAGGFAAPPASRRRTVAHRRAWLGIRHLDRVVVAAKARRLAPAEIVQKAQRAIDRADVLVSALLPA